MIYKNIVTGVVIDSPSSIFAPYLEAVKEPQTEQAGKKKQKKEEE